MLIHKKDACLCAWKTQGSAVWASLCSIYHPFMLTQTVERKGVNTAFFVCLSSAQYGLYMSRWWSQPWIAVGMTWLWWVFTVLPHTPISVSQHPHCRIWKSDLYLAKCVSLSVCALERWLVLPNLAIVYEVQLFFLSAQCDDSEITF